MSIATEITRLQTAKADIKTAIEGKGVTVPSATKLDGYADLVEQIQGGGDNSQLLSILDRSITTLDNAEITKLGTHALYGCDKLTSINLPNLTEITGNYCISNTKITSLYLPSLTSLVGHSIRDNSNLLYLVLPRCTSNGWHLYRNNSALIAADFTDVPGFGQDSFNGNSAMNILVIRRTSSIATLGTVKVFANCPFASDKTGGTLYVPQSLISSYQSATNWSTILGYTNNQILPIEGSIYETQYVDGTPIT